MGKHSALLENRPAPAEHTIPADCLAFAIGTPGNTNHIRGYWVREAGTSHLDIETADGHIAIPLDAIPTLGVMLRNARDLAVTL